MIQIGNLKSEALVPNAEGILIPKKSQERHISYPDHHDDLIEIEENSFWFKHRNNCISKVINKNSPKETIFDVGGGNGYVAKGLIDAGNDVILIEPAIKGARNAKKRGVMKVICSTLEESGFSQGEIPNIGIFDVLEHVENDADFLSYLFQMLKEDGHLYITVPAYQFLWSTEDEEAGHYRRYNLKSISKVLKQAGFDIKFKSHMFFFLPIPVFIFRTIPKKLGITKKKDAAVKELNPPSLSKILNTILALENKIILSRVIRFGGSCLIVAQKKSNER